MLLVNGVPVKVPEGVELGAILSPTTTTASTTVMATNTSAMAHVATSPPLPRTRRHSYVEQDHPTSSHHHHSSGNDDRNHRQLPPQQEQNDKTDQIAGNLLSDLDLGTIATAHSNSYQLLLHHRRYNQLQRLQQQELLQSRDELREKPRPSQQYQPSRSYEEIEESKYTGKRSPLSGASSDASASAATSSDDEEDEVDNTFRHISTVSPSDNGHDSDAAIHTNRTSAHTPPLVLFRERDQSRLNKLYYYIGSRVLEAVPYTKLYENVDETQWIAKERNIQAYRKSVSQGLHFVCRYCRANNDHVHIQSAVFSTKAVCGIYRRIPQFITKHIRSGLCRSIPSEMKETILGMKKTRAEVGNEEFEAMVRANGFRDNEDGDEGDSRGSNGGGGRIDHCPELVENGSSKKK